MMRCFITNRTQGWLFFFLEFWIQCLDAIKKSWVIYKWQDVLPYIDSISLSIKLIDWHFNSWITWRYDFSGWWLFTIGEHKAYNMVGKVENTRKVTPQIALLLISLFNFIVLKNNHRHFKQRIFTCKLQHENLLEAINLHISSSIFIYF